MVTLVFLFPGLVPFWLLLARDAGNGSKGLPLSPIGGRDNGVITVKVMDIRLFCCCVMLGNITCTCGCGACWLVLVSQALALAAGGMLPFT